MDGYKRKSNATNKLSDQIGKLLGKLIFVEAAKANISKDFCEP